MILAKKTIFCPNAGPMAQWLKPCKNNLFVQVDKGIFGIILYFQFLSNLYLFYCCSGSSVFVNMMARTNKRNRPAKKWRNTVFKGFSLEEGVPFLKKCEHFLIFFCYFSKPPIGSDYFHKKLQDPYSGPNVMVSSIQANGLDLSPSKAHTFGSDGPYLHRIWDRKPV